jgi:2,5-diketo-D-gluconate reductase B
MNENTKLLGLMPIIGFGTWEILGSSCTESVNDAINIGYRHIDTAQMYGNEKEVGQGIKQSGIDREDIFVTTKVATSNLESGRIVDSTINSLELLNMDYVDLLLMHWPTPGMNLKACLDTMFELRENNKTKHVGVSNFSPDLFNEAIEIGPIITNQVKFSPYENGFDKLKIARQKNKIITAYSPLGRGSVSGDRTLRKIGKRYNKSEAQVALRWLIQLEHVSVIPKAKNANHRRDNFNIFDFELSEEEMNDIKSMK